jgi:thiamine kinase-like enzyme
MIEGLEQVLEGSRQPGVPQLRCLLQELLGGRDVTGWLTEQHALKRRSRICRLRFVINGRPRAVVVKRLKPYFARRTELIAKRFLPAVDLDDRGPGFLGGVAEPRGNWVWHVYDDFGPHELNGCQVDRERVRAAIDLIARVHTRFAGHPLLGEVRMQGSHFGIHAYESNVNDALHALRAWEPLEPQRELHGRLLGRLYNLRDELPRRAQAMAKWAGPETLLHGDLWPVNVFVIPTAHGPHARLIDWDHTGVGPASYDVSTFLLRFPPQDRQWILDEYRAATARADWSLLPAEELNFLFETAEYGRLANQIIWPVIAIVVDKEDWGLDWLLEVDNWFERFEPVLPTAVAIPEQPSHSRST